MAHLRDIVGEKLFVTKKDLTLDEGCKKAKKLLDAASKKGYKKPQAMLYAESHMRNQGWTTNQCKELVEQAWKELLSKPISEADDEDEGFDVDSELDSDKEEKSTSKKEKPKPPTEPAEMAEQLDTVLSEFKASVKKAKFALTNAPKEIKDHAESYWLAHIITALAGDHDYKGGTSEEDTLESTIKKLSGPDEE